jgi:hypothetical protein
MSFSHGSGLLFLKDSHSKLSFLVDSRATMSILPCSSSAAPSGPKLIGANGANIPTWRFQKCTLAFGNKSFTHEFLLAKVATPILGLDFLEVPAVHPSPASTGIGQRPKATHIAVCRRCNNPTTNSKTDLPPQVRRHHQHGSSPLKNGYQF